MEKIKKFFLALVVFFLFFIALRSQVFAHNNSAPNLECINCHGGAAEEGVVKLLGVPKKYVPGKSYKITLKVESHLKSLGEVQGGFAVQVSAGQLIVNDKKNTQLTDNFLTHTKEGSTRRSWTFEWRAPKEKVEVEMSVMAVAANGDFSPAGDTVATTSLLLSSK